jgi:hypothetical protein
MRTCATWQLHEPGQWMGWPGNGCITGAKSCCTLPQITSLCTCVYLTTPHSHPTPSVGAGTFLVVALTVVQLVSGARLAYCAVTYIPSDTDTNRIELQHASPLYT